ncbi:MAG: DNA integrity scanning protein DisA nucleotide-binding domain protein, partial [Clostridia bacterium]|nr:DNA integrity scanning protein DisA nucleotide-binding domain protein [Clostridia bacterium]
IFQTTLPKVLNNFSNSYLCYTLELLLLFLIVFFVIGLLIHNNGAGVLVIFIVYVVGMSAICLLLETEPIMYLFLILLFVLGIVTIYASEIKRTTWRTHLPKTQFHETATDKNLVQTANNNINEIIKAVQNMSKNDVGAIIVLCNTKVPDNIINSGVKIDSAISSSLIESIFFPKTPLHDGALIIQGNKITSAGCFLPLSQETDLPKDLGTRHRAGIGITESVNATAIIVSEETGIISYAKAGKITRYADSEMLRKVLKDFYWQDLFGQK